MEAIAALSLATNIISVVDFSVRFVRKCIDIKKSVGGLDQEFQDLESMSLQLSNANGVLEKGIASHKIGDSAFAANIDLLPLAKKCQQESSMLIAKIAETKTNAGPGWRKAFIATLKSYRVKQELEEIAARMAQYRSLLDTQILIELRLWIESTVPDQLKKIDELQSTIKDLRGLADENKELLTKEAQVLRDVHLSNAQILQQQHGISDQISQLSLQVQKSDGKQMEAVVDLDSGFVREKLRNTLWFPELNRRREEIHAAHEKTFRWILDDAPPSSLPSNPLLDWLGNTSSQIFWIRGKAGSGKSTLMGYIVNEARTKSILQRWSGHHTLTIVHHYFWYLGTELQKSTSGMLRSIIFQILAALPHLTPIAFPSQSENFRIIECTSNSQIANDWTEKELHRTLNAILQLDVAVRGKICVFLVGLDECSSPGHKLIGMLKPFASFKDIKFCVSSRPLIEFNVSLQSGPMMKLEELTYEDIKLYTRGCLMETLVAEDYINTNPRFIDALSQLIVRKAQGVFLWVRIVVESLIEGMIYQDDMDTLLFNIDCLPSDLEFLYEHMLERLFSRPQQQLEVAVVFQLLFELQQLELFMPTLKMIGGNDKFRKETQLVNTFLDFAIAKDIAMSRLSGKTSSLGDIEKLIKIEGARTIHICAGFLEIDKDYKKVQFFHKTTVDFLCKPAVWSRVIRPTLNSKFRPAEMLLLTKDYQLQKCSCFAAHHFRAMGWLGERLNYQNVVLDELMSDMSLLVQGSRHATVGMTDTLKESKLAMDEIRRSIPALEGCYSFENIDFLAINGIGIFLQHRLSKNAPRIKNLDRSHSRETLKDSSSLPAQINVVFHVLTLLNLVLFYFEQSNSNSHTVNNYRHWTWITVVNQLRLWSTKLGLDEFRKVFAATKSPFVTALKPLLDGGFAGLDINDYGGKRNHYFVSGSTPLYEFKISHKATDIGYDEVVQAFLKRGARAERGNKLLSRRFYDEPLANDPNFWDVETL